MISDDEAGHQVSYWPSVSDLFMTLFITAIALVAVVMFVFLVNPRPGDVFKGRIIELRTLLGMGSLPPENDEKYKDALAETLSRAIAEIKACEQFRKDVAALAICQTEKQRLADENQALKERLIQCMKGPGSRCEEDLADCNKQRQDLERKVAELNDKPPIITIPSDVLFPSGGATVTAVATESLRTGGFQEIAAAIVKRNANALQNVNTLEIIGHTDSMPMKANCGNLDGGLSAVIAGTAPIASLRPGSNNDLGLLRALAIKQTWQAFVAQHSDHAALEQIQVRTYSAGQTIPVHPTGPADDADSRRIELRLTKLADQSASSEASPGP
ncbi:hypothetical protein [uncultured Thiodictyon sp.]|uniref:hypothetical protein n=1 Tax=uncultured Thiodictyon sp. TaxID=1846217 RepID=UPI0025EA8615|nr:hypothetical protein [uncultured Thiodictyon sp.]